MTDINSTSPGTASSAESAGLKKTFPPRWRRCRLCRRGPTSGLAKGEIRLASSAIPAAGKSTIELTLAGLGYTVRRTIILNGKKSPGRAWRAGVVFSRNSA